MVVAAAVAAWRRHRGGSSMVVAVPRQW
jgi:hypothetical protein